MNIVFLGTGAFGIPALQALVSAGWAPKLVISQPDRPAGRRQRLTMPPLAVEARALGLLLEQPERANRDQVAGRLRGMHPDVLVVVAYGQILKRPLLSLPALGCINVHASLLPRHRGASPVQAAILSGDPTTGVTVMLMDEGLDTGPILLQEATPIAPDETAGALEARLSHLGGFLLIRALSDLSSGLFHPKPQDETRATISGLIKKADGRLDWTVPAHLLARRVRAFTPWPGASTELLVRGAPIRLVIQKASVEGDSIGQPGEIIEAEGERLVIATGEGALRLLEVKPAGKRSLSAAEFLRGYPLELGERARSPA